MSISVIIEHYPLAGRLAFNVDEPLPKFEYGCPVRTEIARKEIADRIDETNHRVEDFIVETVSHALIDQSECEHWTLGS